MEGVKVITLVTICIYLFIYLFVHHMWYARCSNILPSCLCHVAFLIIKHNISVRFVSTYCLHCSISVLKYHESHLFIVP